MNSPSDLRRITDIPFVATGIEGNSIHGCFAEQRYAANDSDGEGGKR